MRVEDIIKKFEKRGHKITRSIQSGDVIIKTRWGFEYTFSSYNKAYHYFFK